MHQVGKSHPIPLILGDLDAEAGLEEGQSPRRHDPIIDLAVGAAEAIGEVEEEASEGAEAEEGVDHGGADGGAGPVSGDRGEEHLKGEEGAGWEEIDQHRSLGKRFLDSLGHGSPLPAAVGRR